MGQSLATAFAGKLFPEHFLPEHKEKVQLLRKCSLGTLARALLANTVAEDGQE